MRTKYLGFSRHLQPWFTNERWLWKREGHIYFMKSRMQSYFILFTKPTITKQNENQISEALYFFKLLHAILGQKLMILKFSPMIFLFLPLATLWGRWGQANGLSDLIRVPNETQRSHLLYEMLIHSCDLNLFSTTRPCSSKKY